LIQRSHRNEARINHLAFCAFRETDACLCNTLTSDPTTRWQCHPSFIHACMQASKHAQRLPIKLNTTSATLTRSFIV
jgi:hypothetical protein